MCTYCDEKQNGRRKDLLLLINILVMPVAARYGCVGRDELQHALRVKSVIKYQAIAKSGH